MKVPKLTAPLVKFARTGEGVLVFGSNLALIVVTAVTQTLSPNEALKYAVILNGVTVVSRSVLKATTLFKGVTGIQPATVSPSALPDAQTLVTQVVDQIKADVASGKLDPSTIAGQAAGDVPDVGKVIKDVGTLTDPSPTTATAYSGPQQEVPSGPPATVATPDQGGRPT